MRKLAKFEYVKPKTLISSFFAFKDSTIPILVNQKSKDSSLPLLLYRQVCVGTCCKPQRPVLSHQAVIYINFDIFLIFARNIDCGYRLEPPRRGGSNKYPQSMFWSKNKKNRFTPVYSSFNIYKSVVQGGILFTDMLSWSSINICSFFTPLVITPLC